MWDLPGPGIEVSPALAGGFVTTEPPRKPLVCLFVLNLSIGNVCLGKDALIFQDRS